MLYIAFFLAVVVPVLLVILQDHWGTIAEWLRTGNPPGTDFSRHVLLAPIAGGFAFVAIMIVVSGFVTLYTPSEHSESTRYWETQKNATPPGNGSEAMAVRSESDDERRERERKEEFEARTKNAIDRLQKRDAGPFKLLTDEDKRLVLEDQFFAANLLHGRPGNTWAQNEAVGDYIRFLKRVARDAGFNGDAFVVGA